MNKTGKVTREQYRRKVTESFSEKIRFGSLTFIKKQSMRYGENPGYPAAFYQEEGARGPNMGTLEVLQEGTKGLGYINIGDMDLGQRLIKKLDSIYPGRRICVLVKHEMPSGVAMEGGGKEVFLKAWQCDPLSNFGSVDVFNYEVGADLADAVVEKGRNVEVVYAPGFSPEALDVFATRKPLRVVRMGSGVEVPSVDENLEFKRVVGGMLVQQRFDSRIVSPDSVDVVSRRKPTAEEIDAAVFNWTVACFTRSNAIVIGTRDKVHGIGSGQRSRIDAAEDAVKLSKRGYGCEGCVMASDAFMPFTDVVETAARNGITALIYPLGSMRDQDVIDKADEFNLAMIVTKTTDQTDSERCFLHR